MCRPINPTQRSTARHGIVGIKLLSFLFSPPCKHRSRQRCSIGRSRCQREQKVALVVRQDRYRVQCVQPSAPLRSVQSATRQKVVFSFLLRA